MPILILAFLITGCSKKRTIANREVKKVECPMFKKKSIFKKDHRPKKVGNDYKF